MQEEKNKEFDYLATYIILRAAYEKGIITERRFNVMNQISALDCNVPPIFDELIHSSNSSK